MAQHRARTLEKRGGKEWQSHPEFEEEMEGRAVYHDDDLIVLPDKYPKSGFHFLVLPRDFKRLQSLNDLERRDVPLVQRMRSIGTSIAEAIQSSGSDQAEIMARPELINIFTPSQAKGVELERLQKAQAELARDSVFDRTRPLVLETPSGLITLPSSRVKFVQGFHSMPSLAPLHMHVLSLDLLSACLKNKKHYNSFTSKFFLASKAIEDDLAQRGCITINQTVHVFEFEERKPLECVWCGLACDGMPALRRHLPVCHKNAALMSS